MSRSLEFASSFINGLWGNIIEADLFEHLRQCPEIVRAFEFALADGAIDCTRSRNEGDTYAERFWDVYRRDASTGDCGNFGLFDCKATVNLDPGDQQYLSTMGQQKRVAFYLCVHAANLNYVDLIPNFHQDSTALKSEAPRGTRECDQSSVTVTRKSRLFAAAHDSLDLTGTAYRMLLGQLPEAIRRVRLHIQSQGAHVYVNPHSGVSFPDWRPRMTQNISWLKPAESNDQYTGFTETMKLYPALQLEKSPVQLEFVGLQPLLADFKFVQKNDALHAIQGSLPAQWFVQHKVDARVRARGTTLNKVAIARGGGYYFDARSRADFIMYYFEFGKHYPDMVVLFLPERVIPDEFYSTLDVEADFEIDAFSRYRVVIDRDFAWIDDLQKIIADNPAPRCQHERPIRTKVKPPKAAEKQVQPVKAKKVPRGYFWRAKAMLEGHRRFFYTITEQCARRRSGLLIELARNHNSADFGYCAWAWSAEEAEEYLKSGRLPATVQDLPPTTPVIPIFFYTTNRECHASGPRVSPCQFRRLNCNSTGRIIVWDIGGKDAIQQPVFAVIPSHDIQPTTAQIDRLASNAESERRGENCMHNPSVLSMLSTGLPISAYTLPLGTGPACYSQDAWSTLCVLLERFTRLEPVYHPVSVERHPEQFRQTLLEINTRLARQFEANDRAHVLGEEKEDFEGDEAEEEDGVEV